MIRAMNVVEAIVVCQSTSVWRTVVSAHPVGVVKIDCENHSLLHKCYLTNMRSVVSKENAFCAVSGVIMMIQSKTCFFLYFVLSEGKICFQFFKTYLIGSWVFCAEIDLVRYNYHLLIICMFLKRCVYKTYKGMLPKCNQLVV